MRSMLFYFVVSSVGLLACGDDAAPTDAGPSRSDGSADGGGPDAGIPSSVRIVASEGGIVGSADGVFRLLVPPGALAKDTDLSVRVVPRAEWPAEIAATTPIGEVYDVTPDGLEFVTPAYAIHEWPSLPGELTSTPGELTLGIAHSRSSAGAIEIVESSTRVLPDRAFVAGAIEHLSPHWVTGSIGGTVIGVTLDADGGSHEVGLSWSVTRREVRSGRPIPSAGLFAGARVYSSPGLVDVAVPSDFTTTREVGFLDLYATRTDSIVTSTSPTITEPLSPAFGVSASVAAPGWICLRESGAGDFATISAFAGVVVDGTPFSAEVVFEPDVVCAPSSGPALRSTIARPEGLSLFRRGAGTSSLPFLDLGGIPDGDWAFTVGSDGMLDLVHLDTGERRTNAFAPAGYGVAAFAAPAGPLLLAVGPGGIAMAGWNDELGDFGLTALGSSGNFTHIAVADVDGDGTAEHIVYTDNSGARFRVEHLVDDTVDQLFGTNPRFPGGVIAASPIAAELGATDGDLVIVLENGQVLHGSYRGTEPIVLVGTAGSDPRLLDCVGSAPRVCAIAGYGDDTIYIAEIDAGGARMTASLAVGDAPIEPALRLDGGNVEILVTGSGDHTLEVLEYDPGLDTLVSLVPRAILEECLEPAHSAWRDANTAVVSCHGSNALSVVALARP
jgi:hypothetical protein